MLSKLFPLGVKQAWPLIFLFLTLMAYSVWSFALTDPNLVYLKFEPFWVFQTWIWQTLFKHAPALSAWYVGILALIWVAFALVVKQAQFWTWRWQHWFVIWLATISPLLFANNALSHDVFNYIFNAKMVLVYQANPHIKVALDFADDPLLRFMHNTHTPAPYGYGWTAFSLIPSALGLGKFLWTWWLFKWVNVIGTAALFWVLFVLHQQIYQKQIAPQDVVLVFFNPLFIIELIGNSHNDLWLMVPALAALYLAGEWFKKFYQPNYKFILMSLGLLGFSISTKLVTVVLLPIWGAIAAWPLQLSEKFRSQLHSQIKQISAQTGIPFTWESLWPLLASMSLFIPLFTARSQQFHPWYWTWVLVWLPLIKLDWWRQVIIAFSLSSLLRYVPWLLNGGYTESVLQQQRWITWSIPLIWLLIYRGYQQYRYQHIR